MSVVTTVPPSIKAPFAPQVNLIPPEVAGRRARGRTRVLIVGVLGIVVVALGGGVFLADVYAKSAQAELEDVRLETERLNSEILALAEVPRVEAELANVTSARRYTGAFELKWSERYDALRAAVDPRISFNRFEWILPGLFGSAPPNISVFGSPDIGGATFDGQSLDYIDVVQLVEDLNSVEGFQGAEVTSVRVQLEDGRVYYEFTGSVRLTPDVFTNRFSEEWLAAEAIRVAEEAAEEEDDVVVAPEPSPSPSATEEASA